MGSILQRHALAVALGIVGIALLLVIGFETGWGSRLRAPDPLTGPAKGAAVEAKLLPPIVATSPEAVYPETGARPIFVPTRRPSPAAVAVAAMNKGQYVLQGVTIVGDLKIAMLKEKSGTKTHRIELGKELNGITVAVIEPDRVTLRMGDDSEVVPLNIQRVEGRAGTPALGPNAPAGAAASGPFSVPPSAAQAAPATAPGMPGVPAAAGAVQRGTTGPMPTAPVPGSGPVPAQGGGGPTPVPMTGGAPQPATQNAAQPPMTAEEILARRRARRTQQQQ